MLKDLEIIGITGMYLINDEPPMEVDVSNYYPNQDIQYLRRVPKRKNKRKRITKKWLKRYGYRCVLTTIKGWDIKSTTNDYQERARRMKEKIGGR